jgi:CBS domain-containing protein
MLLRDVMSHPVVTVVVGTTIAAAADILVRSGFTALPVLDADDGALVGIVTEADLIRDRIPGDSRTYGPQAPRVPSSATVAEVMTTSVESMTPGADAADAALMMDREGIRCVPVVDGIRVVGVVTRRDLLRANIARTDLDVVDEVRRRLGALGDSGRWVVSIRRGVVDIEDLSTDPERREIARRLASAVPGVVSAHVHHQTPDPF